MVFLRQAVEARTRPTLQRRLLQERLAGKERWPDVGVQVELLAQAQDALLRPDFPDAPLWSPDGACGAGRARHGWNGEWAWDLHCIEDQNDTCASVEMGDRQKEAKAYGESAHMAAFTLLPRHGHQVGKDTHRG